jgi:hypothetical protein
MNAMVSSATKATKPTLNYVVSLMPDAVPMNLKRIGPCVLLHLTGYAKADAPKNNVLFDCPDVQR